MKSKSGIRAVLLVVALGSLAVWGAREVRKSREIAAVSAAPQVKEIIPVVQGKQVVMTYFRSGVRCASCKKIESLTAETAQNELADAIARGVVVFRVVDVDEPANRHYIKDYQLSTKSVILSFRQDGKELRWENREKVWDLLDDPAAFRVYLAEPVLTYLQS